MALQSFFDDLLPRFEFFLPSFDVLLPLVDFLLPIIMSWLHVYPQLAMILHRHLHKLAQTLYTLTKISTGYLGQPL